MLINQIANTIPSLVSAMAYMKLLPMDEYGSFRIYSHSNYIICRPLHPISCRKALAYWEAWFYSYGFARALWLSTHLEIGESIGSSHPKSQNFHNPNICNASSRSFMSNFWFNFCFKARISFFDYPAISIQSTYGLRRIELLFALLCNVSQGILFVAK